MLHILISRETFKHAFFVIGITPNPKFFNIQNRDHLTPLHLAVKEQEPTLCRTLLLAGASLSIQNKPLRDTPLHMACRNGANNNDNLELCVKALTEPLTPTEITWLNKNARRISRSKRDFEILNAEGKNKPKVICT